MASQTGPSLGYSATNTGTIQIGSPQTCTIGGLQVKANDVVKSSDNKWYRCDIRDETQTDVNLPLPDSICPS
jgi:hypothetical protein